MAGKSKTLETIINNEKEVLFEDKHVNHLACRLTVIIIAIIIVVE